MQVWFQMILDQNVIKFILKNKTGLLGNSSSIRIAQMRNYLTCMYSQGQPNCTMSLGLVAKKH